MAAGFGSFGDGDVTDCCAVRRHFLQAAIRACERGLRWQLACGLLVVMQQTAVLPDVMFLTADISASESQQRQQDLGLLTMMQLTIVLTNDIYYKPPSVLVTRTCGGSGLLVFWRW